VAAGGARRRAGPGGWPDQGRRSAGSAPRLKLVLDPPDCGLCRQPPPAWEGERGPWASAVANPARGLDLTRGSGHWVGRAPGLAGEAPPRQGTGEWWAAGRQGEGLGVARGEIDGGAGQGSSSELLASPTTPVAAGREPGGRSARRRGPAAGGFILSPGAPLAEAHSNAAFGVGMAWP